MKLWKGNRLDCEYEATEEEIVDGFLNSTIYANWMKGLSRGNLDFCLRWYISSPDGLGSTFEDDDYFTLFKMVELKERVKAKVNP